LPFLSSSLSPETNFFVHAQTFKLTPFVHFSRRLQLFTLSYSSSTNQQKSKLQHGRSTVINKLRIADSTLSPNTNSNTNNSLSNQTATTTYSKSEHLNGYPRTLERGGIPEDL
jgi:hypothetical protein